MNGRLTHEQATRWSDLPLVLTAAEAAEVLRLQRRTVTNMLGAGRLKGVRITKDWRISRTELMRFMGEDGGQDTAVKSAQTQVAEGEGEDEGWEFDGLLRLAGKFAGGPPDLSSDKYKYLAEAYDHAAA